jgi:hypothetical protein
VSARVTPKFSGADRTDADDPGDDREFRVAMVGDRTGAASARTVAGRTGALPRGTKRLTEPAGTERTATVRVVTRVFEVNVCAGTTVQPCLQPGLATLMFVMDTTGRLSKPSGHQLTYPGAYPQETHAGLQRRSPIQNQRVPR